MTARERLLVGGLLAVAAVLTGALRLLLTGEPYEDRTLLGPELPTAAEAALLVAVLAQATFAARVRSVPAAVVAAALLALFAFSAHAGTDGRVELGWTMYAPLSDAESPPPVPVEPLTGWPLALAVGAVAFIAAGLARRRRR